jgi:hypothetical protein
LGEARTAVRQAARAGRAVDAHLRGLVKRLIGFKDA